MAKFKVISDAPAESDSFTSHQPVADAIASLIIDETRRGKAIGLSGPWGSGKSTIIELLRKKLHEQPAAHLFVWDAWAHQGDPLRLAFLESVAEYLGSDRIFWIERQKWKDLLDLLSGRKTKTETTTEKRLTFWGTLVAILLIFCFPLGLAIASKYSAKPSEEKDTFKFLWIGVVLFLLPLVAAVVAWIWQRIGGRGSGENHFLRLLVREPRETVVSTSSKTLDPTSAEFRAAFVQMLDDALSCSGRRLVVVIDNLDRLDPEAALGVWSTMRIFFELDSRQDPDWASRFWLVVPFDRDALKRLWKSGPNSDPNEAGLLVDSFVNKTFQIVFDVAPPVVLRRIEYFGNLYKRAFPDAQEYGDTIYRLYDRLGPNSPSPREIKLFLNKVGALYLQRRSGIALPLLALYRLKEREITPGARELLKPDFLEARTLSLLGEEDWRVNWRKYLAAAHFNVPPDEALHVLNGDKIAQALESGQPQEVAKLVAEEGFWQICDRVIWDRSPTWKQQAVLLTNATRSLADNQPPANPQSEKVWSDLESIAQEVVNWEPVDQESATGAELLLIQMRGRNPHYREICERLVQAAAKPPRIAITNSTTMQAAESWHQGALTVLRVVDGHKTSEDLNPVLSGILSVNDWGALQFALFRAQAGAAFTSRFACQEEDAIPAMMATTFPVVGYGDDFLKFAEHLKTTMATLRWIELNAHLTAAFEVATGPRETAILRCALRLNPDLDAFSATGVSAEVLSRKLTTAFAANEWKAAGVCLAPLLEYAIRIQPGALKPVESALGGPSEVIREFADSLIDLDRCQLLFDAPTVPDAWVTQVQGEALWWIGGRQDGGSHLSPMLFAAGFPTVREKLFHTQDRLDCLVKSWIDRVDVVPFLIDPANLIRRNAALYAHVLRAGEFPRKAELVAAVLNDLSRTSEAKLLSAIANPDFEDLVLQVTRIAGPGWIPAAVARALLQTPPQTPPPEAPGDLPRTPPPGGPSA